MSGRGKGGKGLKKGGKLTLNISNTLIKAYNGKNYHPPLSVVFHCAFCFCWYRIWLPRV